MVGQKKKIENNKQKQLRFLMPQTSGHTQVSQSQSSSSAHVPGQSQTLSFTNPRRSQSFFDMFCPNTNCCPKKYVLHSLSLSTQSRNRLVRSNCQEVDIGSEAVAQGLALLYTWWNRLCAEQPFWVCRSHAQGPKNKGSQKRSIGHFQDLFSVLWTDHVYLTIFRLPNANLAWFCLVIPWKPSGLKPLKPRWNQHSNSYRAVHRRWGTGKHHLRWMWNPVDFDIWWMVPFQLVNYRGSQAPGLI